MMIYSIIFVYLFYQLCYYLQHKLVFRGVKQKIRDSNEKIVKFINMYY